MHSQYLNKFQNFVKFAQCYIENVPELGTGGDLMEDLNAPIDMAAHIRDTKESLAEIEEDVHCLLKMNKGGENITGLSVCCINYRINAGWPIEDALSKPSIRPVKKSN